MNWTLLTIWNPIRVSIKHIGNSHNQCHEFAWWKWKWIITILQTRHNHTVTVSWVWYTLWQSQWGYCEITLKRILKTRLSVGSNIYSDVVRVYWRYQYAKKSLIFWSKYILRVIYFSKIKHKNHTAKGRYSHQNLMHMFYFYFHLII